jgi:hypothetical protein
VNKSDVRGGNTVNHDFTWSPFGLLHDSHQSTYYTPGFAHRANGIDRYYHTDWLGSTRYVTDRNRNMVAGLTCTAIRDLAGSGDREARHRPMPAGGDGWRWRNQCRAHAGVRTSIRVRRRVAPSEAD